MLEGERERRNLDAPTSALSIISNGKFEPLPFYVDVQWDSLSDRNRKYHTEKAEETVSLVLGTIAPF